MGHPAIPGSQDQYHRSLDTFYTTPAKELVNDDGEPALGRRARNWHAGLPEPPEDFPRKATLRLTRIEGEYLRERVLTQLPRTLLAYLVSEVEPAEDIVFPWEHPDLAAFPAHNRLELHHARCFSEVIHGSVLLYNLMLAEKRASEELIERYRTALAEWAALLASRERELAAWDRAEFWHIVPEGERGISAQTRLFIDGWLGLSLDGVGRRRWRTTEPRASWYTPGNACSSEGLPGSTIGGRWRTGEERPAWDSSITGGIPSFATPSAISRSPFAKEAGDAAD